MVGALSLTVSAVFVDIGANGATTRASKSRVLWICWK